MKNNIDDLIKKLPAEIDGEDWQDSLITFNLYIEKYHNISGLIIYRVSYQREIDYEMNEIANNVYYESPFLRMALLKMYNRLKSDNIIKE